LNPRILDVDISDLKGDKLREVSTPRAPLPSDEEEIELALIDAGLKPTPAVLQKLDEIIDRRADCRAAEAIRHLIRNMPGTAAAAALEREILKEEEPVREAAERIGCSHVAILKHEKKIAKRVALSPVLDGGLPKPAIGA
jgi:hypothetical protein